MPAALWAHVCAVSYDAGSFGHSRNAAERKRKSETAHGLCIPLQHRARSISPSSVHYSYTPHMSASRSESIPCSLKTLHSHSIFIPGPASDSKSDSEWELVEHPDAGREELVPLKRQRMVMRDKEIIVAVGKDVRMATVSGDRFEMRNEKVGSYSVRITSSLKPSPNGKSDWSA